MNLQMYEVIQCMYVHKSDCAMSNRNETGTCRGETLLQDTFATESQEYV